VYVHQLVFVTEHQNKWTRIIPKSTAVWLVLHWR